MQTTSPRSLGLAPLALVISTACQDATTAPRAEHESPQAPRLTLTTDAGGALITTSTVRLGLRREGVLGADYVRSPTGGASEVLGLRYVPTNLEAVYFYDNWAVADATAPAYSDAMANPSTKPERFVSDDDRTAAVTILGRRTDAGKQLRVTHAYSASEATPNLFAVRVTIENAGSAPIGELRYARGFFWFLRPQHGDVTVTIQGTAASRYVLGASNYVVADPLGPLAPTGSGWLIGDFVDAPTPPASAGNASKLVLRLGALGVGERVEFTTYIGAAGTEAEALGALAAVGADVYALAQADAGAPVPGAPHTFMYAFSSASVSGAPRGAGTPLLDHNSGRCLDVLGASREPGTPLVIYDCHGGENQRFTYPPVGGTGEVRAYGGTMCLDAYTGRGQNGDRIVVWPCHGGANQQWTRTLGGELRGVNGKCIDVLGARTENLTDVWLWTCHGGANQRWQPASAAAAAAEATGVH